MHEGLTLNSIGVTLTRLRRYEEGGEAPEGEGERDPVASEG